MNRTIKEIRCKNEKKIRRKILRESGGERGIRTPDPNFSR
jgi:hypothetical protein